ncbi:MAG: hypothetical protein AAGJ87_15075, partial [Pseudomonadota bacterium]
GDAIAYFNIGYEGNDYVGTFVSADISWRHREKANMVTAALRSIKDEVGGKIFDHLGQELL